MADKIKKSDNNEKIFTIAVVIIIVLSLLLIISRNFGTFNNVKVKKNNNNIFSVSDLTVNNLKFHDDEKTVRKELGTPKKEKKYLSNIYSYKDLYYDGIIVTLKEDYNDYRLVKVQITSKKYKINRNIKVNDRILRVIKKFKVEYESGTYLYGSHTIKALNDKNTTENVYLGVRSTKELVYINKDAKVGDENPNIAKLVISYKFGKVSKITWSYDYK